LQSLDLTAHNERVVYVDGNGTKIADSDKKLGLDSSESFGGLESFHNAMNGEFGSIGERVSQTPMIVSYYPVEALQNTWAVLWMQPISHGLADNATMTTSDLNLNNASAIW
ncbi:MAG: hypothetical protein WBX01_04115, partial [Nitrososphaeraceae archaeon]